MDNPEKPERERPITRLRIPPEMVIDHENPRYERPKPDPVLIALSCISVAAWLIVVTALLYVLRARPETGNLFDVYVKNRGQVQKEWKSEFLHVSFYLMLANFVLTTVGTSVRVAMKKPFTRGAVSLVILGILSLVMAVVLFLFW